MSNQNKLKELGYELQQEYRGYRMYVKTFKVDTLRTIGHPAMRFTEQWMRNYCLWIAEKENKYSVAFTDMQNGLQRQNISFDDMVPKLEEFEKKIASMLAKN